MYLDIKKISIDYDSREVVLTDTERPTFSWSVYSDGDGGFQTSYKITVSDRFGVKWESGEVFTAEQKAVYNGAPLISGEYYTLTLSIKDNRKRESEAKSATFRYLGEHTWTAKWITTEKEGEREAKYFYRGFNLLEKPVRATLYASGLGYQYITVNGEDVEKSYLNPSVSVYNEHCYYTVTDITSSLTDGENGVFAVVGNGWRYIKGYYEDLGRGCPDFYGDTRLILEIELLYADGRVEKIFTDESWLAGFGAITSQSLFDGEVYDARAALVGWDSVGFQGDALTPAVICEKGNVGVLIPQTHPPITEYKRLKAKNIYRKDEDSYIIDFGENIAGVGCLKIPEGLAVGSRVTIEYAEEIFDGDLGKETLRRAKATDTYISGEKNLSEWIPHNCYHGFRYAKISGLGHRPAEDTLVAIAFCNDIKNNSYFRCGSALVNQIQENIVRTEMDNLHHLATDCPQRDERMGWMNDATVRFEEMPYNFHTGRMYRKILRDMRDEQDKENGGITCTAPYIWGSRPADPVCSSYLVLGLQMALHYGDVETAREYYEPYKAWNNCLRALRTEEGIVEYVKYGDWAGPEDCCTMRFEGVRSALTSSAMMSTGYHYYNYKLLAKFAKLLGKEDEEKSFLEESEKVRAAFLKKWFDEKHGYVDRGSQGAQAFALWLEILPKECEKMAAKRMLEAVETVGYRITTGNLTTKYLLDMLAKFGYEDAAWKLLNREKYPSWGYMIQHGATTIWERFEDKLGSQMNSHNHPMYGAIGYWFYAYLLGVKPEGYGFDKFEVAPIFPKDLLSAEGRVETLYGDIFVCWHRQYDRIYVTVDVPFGTTATLRLSDTNRTLKSGVHSFSFED